MTVLGEPTAMMNDKLGVRGFRRLGQELERSITRKSFEFRDFRAKDFLLAVEKQE